MPFERYMRHLLMTKQRLPRWSWKHCDACFHVGFPLKFTLVIQNLRVVLLFNDILTLIFFFCSWSFCQISICFQFHYWIHNYDLLFFQIWSLFILFWFFFWILLLIWFFFQFHFSNQNSKLSSYLFFITQLVLIFLITIVCFFYPFI
jgi:hypothetical protein